LENLKTTVKECHQFNNFEGSRNGQQAPEVEPNVDGHDSTLKKTKTRKIVE
jgi:hypothetical protein